MSYTAQTLAQATAERLRTMGMAVPPSLTPRLVTLVPSALRMLPVKVRQMMGHSEAELYRKNFDVALTAGSGPLAAHTDLASEPMIPSEIVKVTHPDVTGKLQRVGSESALDLEHTTEFGFYAVEDNTLYTMYQNDRAALTGTATVRAGFEPLISSVKFSHEPILLECMVELVKGEAVKAT